MCESGEYDFCEVCGFSFIQFIYILYSFIQIYINVLVPIARGISSALKDEQTYGLSLRGVLNSPQRLDVKPSDTKVPHVYA